MVGQSLKQLEEQIKFLVDVEQDSFEECLQEFGSLMLFLEQAATAVQDDSVDAGLELVRKILTDNYQNMRSEYETELAYLRQQLKIVQQALSVKDTEKLAQLEGLILEDVGTLESNDSFKKRVSETNAETRQEFLSVVSEIREAVSTGSVDELAAFFHAAQVANEEGLNVDDEDDEDSFDVDDDDNDSEAEQESEECQNCLDSNCQEGEHPFDFTTNDEIMNILKEFSEPYSVESKK